MCWLIGFFKLESWDDPLSRLQLDMVANESHHRFLDSCLFLHLWFPSNTGWIMGSARGLLASCVSGVSKLYKSRFSLFQPMITVMIPRVGLNCWLYCEDYSTMSRNNPFDWGVPVLENKHQRISWSLAPKLLNHVGSVPETIPKKNKTNRPKLLSSQCQSSWLPPFKGDKD